MKSDLRAEERARVTALTPKCPIVIASPPEYSRNMLCREKAEFFFGGRMICEEHAMQREATAVHPQDREGG